jgi:hypothetical protein
MAKRIKSSKHHEWAVRDGRRAVLAALLLIFVAAATLSDGKFMPGFLTGERFGGTRMGEKETDRRTDGGDLRTGSVLITPRDGNICEHRLIDNETWRIRPNGTIQCDNAVSWQAHRDGVYTPQTRIEAIRDGFVSKR